MNTVIMSNLTKLEINALDITGNNYMTWAVGAKMHLRGNRLLETIDSSKTVSYLHAAALVRLRPSAYHKYSPLQLASGQEPDYPISVSLGAWSMF